MRKFLLLLSFLSFSTGFWSQAPYSFKEVIDLETTPVISQGITGTCWSFSSTSFLESEILRIKGETIDLSEMYSVRQTYPLKAENFLMRQGKAQFSEGGLAHDVINSMRWYGLVPNAAYDGLIGDSRKHNHAEMVAVMEAMLKTYIAPPGGTLSTHWREAISKILDSYLGEIPDEFTYQGKTYTPKSFLEMTGLNPDDYVTLTSFTHRPFYENFILNIPDNWSNGSMFNLPLDDYIQVITHALENGYTVELDCDSSERSFSSKDGVAVVPEDPANTIKALQGVYPEKAIDQKYRQQEFENYHTTDDHLMHITGMLKDQKDRTFFKVKNSWGTDPVRNANGGYMYFSESYMRLKSISIMVHKDALPKEITKKLKI